MKWNGLGLFVVHINDTREITEKIGMKNNPNKQHLPVGNLMLGQQCIRWINIKTASCQRTVFAVI